MVALRDQSRAGARRECATCVCSLWRQPESRGISDFMLPRRIHA